MLGDLSGKVRVRKNKSKLTCFAVQIVFVNNDSLRKVIKTEKKLKGRSQECGKENFIIDLLTNL